MESPADRAAVEAVNRRAFGRPDEGRLVAALRDRGHARLSLVAEVEDAVVGHIMFSALVIETEAGGRDALALAPVAVVPELQGKGLGSRLVAGGLHAAAAEGHEIVLVLGDPAYYSRFGFSSELAGGLASPYPEDAFMAVEIVPGALEGVRGRVVYPSPFEEV